MASWGVYTALAGFEYDGPKGRMGFAPRVTPENFRAAFTAAEGWGSFSQTRRETVQREQIELRWGRLTLQSLAFAMPADWTDAGVVIRLNDKDISNKTLFGAGRVEIEMNDSQTLSLGDRLEVEIRRKGQS
jgi:hypothetical protein